MNYLIKEGILYLEDCIEIEPRQFYENIEISGIVFPDELKVIGEEAFAGCHNIESIVLPESVIEIRAGAFFENTKLKEVKLNKNLEVIGEGAFLSCTNLKEIDIPEKVKEIPEMCFYGCGLERVELKENIETVGDQAFWGNEELKEADILSPYVRLGLDIFGTCYKLKSGYVAKGYPDEMELYDEILYSLLALTSYERHNEEVKEAVREYSKENLKLLMEKILKTGNTLALNTLVKTGILNGNVDEYLNKAFERKQNELVALLMQVKNDGEDLEL